jgi:hypothetical protein
MNLSDCKFFLILAVIGVIAYSIAFPWGWSRYSWTRRPAPSGPGYIIVPKNYPGARPLDEVKPLPSKPPGN